MDIYRGGIMRTSRSIVLATVTFTLGSFGAAAAAFADNSGGLQAPPGCVLAAPNTYGQVLGLCAGDQYEPAREYYQLPGYPTSPPAPAPTTVAPVTVTKTVVVTVTVTKVKIVRCRWVCR